MIDAGKPMHNPFEERFNGKFRAECLTLTTLEGAKVKTDARRQECGDAGAHSSPDYLTPGEFAIRCRPS